MIGLTSLEVFNCIPNRTEQNNKFKRYTFPVSKIGGVTHEKVREEIEKDLDISDITASDLQHKILGPIFTKQFWEVSKRLKNDKYMAILAGYTSSILEDFESSLRVEVHLLEDNIRLDIDKYNSSYITDELPPGINTFKDFSEYLSIQFSKRKWSQPRDWHRSWWDYHEN